MTPVDRAIARAKDQKKAHLAQFKEILSIPSISTLSERGGDLRRCAQRLAEHLRAAKMENVCLKETGGHPIVYGDWLHAPSKPTMLIYGHYDVQPADPLEEWDSPPFEPTIREDYIYARGASDMKGQILAQIKALECLVQDGDPPLNIKYLIEGEEEVGSENLEGFIDKNGDLLAADFVLNCDAGIHGPDEPAIVYALRGLAYFELEVRGPSRDLHSGRFGGSVHNPLNVLCELIAGMHDSNGRVTLPGFYDTVRDLLTEERDALAKLPFSEENWLSMSGSTALYGESGYTTVERVGARPALDVNGIWGGYTGEGAKTVLPSVARAKLSARLVADQDHKQIAAQLQAYLDEHVPHGITCSVQDLGSGACATMDRHSKYMQSAIAALNTVYGKDPIFTREGGSIPVVGMLQEKLGLDSIMLGFSLPDDGIHGPNERQHLPSFYRGIETYIRFMSQVGG